MGSRLSHSRSERGSESRSKGKGACAASAAQASEPAAGIELDLPAFPDAITTEAEVASRFTQFSAIGEGAFAKVYEAEEAATGQRLAMKKVLISSLYAEASRLPALREEVRLQRACDHPSLLRIVDVLETPEAVYIFSELLQGGELFSLIQLNQWRGWASEDHPREIMRQLLEGLRYLHEERRTLHGDIKPENIMMSAGSHTADGRLPEGCQLKLIDFGFARSLPADAAADALAFEGMGGTLEYSAPELLRKQAYGLSADMWSAGVVLYLLCCGSLPVTVRCKQDLAQLLRGDFPMEGDTWSAVSEPCKDLVTKLLAALPASRLTAAQALAHEWMASSS